MSLERLKGTQDLLGSAHASHRAIQEALQAFLASYGYEAIDTPILELTELYLRKSGGELTSRLYAFTDQGGHQISLRPEFTASVIRAYLQDREKSPLPLRWQYSGPVFRYEPLKDSQYRQFTQLGAELLGAGGPRADAEIISLACKGLQEVGIASSRLVIGHLGPFLYLLEGLGLSGRVKAFLIGSLGQISRGGESLEGLRERGRKLNLFGEVGEKGYLEDLVGELGEEEARAVIQGLLRGGGNEVTGGRDPEEIVSRFLQKMRGGDDPAKVERGLLLTSKLSQTRGQPSKALSRAKEVLKELDFDLAVLESLERVLDLLKDNDLGDVDVSLDFGLARDIAYYTGMVFEIYHPSAMGELRLCGGGRYDGLVKALGAEEDTPALGFAYGVELMQQALEGLKQSPASNLASDIVALVVPTSAKAYTQALRVADEMRKGGQRVEMEVCGFTIEESILYAKRKGIATVRMVDEKGSIAEHEVEGHVKARSTQ